MASETLYLLYEPVVASSFWNRQTIDAIRRQAAYKRLTMREIAIGDLNSIGRGNVLMLISGTIAWHKNVLDQCLRQGIKPMFLPGTQSVFSTRASVIMLDQEFMCESVCRYCLNAGREKIAFFANNPRSVTDLAKLNGLKQASGDLGISFSDNDVFHNTGNLKKCIENFTARAGCYNAAICANDAAAASLINDPVFREQVRVPEDLYVITLGTSTLARLTNPSLTGVGLDFQEVGVLAVSQALYLARHPEVNAIRALLKPTFFLGASTAYTSFDFSGITSAHAVSDESTAIDQSFYSDKVVQEFQRIESLLIGSDKLDRNIIAAVLREEPTAKTIENSFISESTYKYRVRNICRTLEAENRAGIRDILNRWTSRDAVLAWVEETNKRS